MTNYLIISPAGLSLFIVPRLNKESSVKKIYFCPLDPADKSLGKGMENLPDWNKLEVISDPSYAITSHKPEDLIIFIDDVGLGYLGKMYRQMGYRVIGGSPLADMIEDDRDFATQLMSKYMDVPETHSFTSFADAISFAKTQDKEARFVFKPNDSNVPKDYTYNAKDIPDLISAMRSFEDEWQWKESFQLQKFVKGAEMDFNAYFNGKEYLSNSMFYYFENKPVGNDDIGPATGGAIAVQFARKLEGEFFAILEKIKPQLIADNYVGQIAINTIISEETHTPHFLEFCGRVGYPSFPMDITALEDNDRSLHQLFLALANGENPTLFPLNKIMATVWCGIPPYPYKEGTDINEGVPISWSKKWDSYFFPYYVKYQEKKDMVAAGLAGEIVQVTCADATLDGAVSMIYDTYMPTLKVKNLMYRSDLGKSAKERIKKLREWKVIT